MILITEVWDSSDRIPPGVYGGLTTAGPLREDMPLPMTPSHVIPAFKKIGELLTGHLAGETGIEIVSYRTAAVWGPRGRAASPFFPAPQLVHAAVRGAAPDLPALRTPAYAEDSIDLCYAADCGRALALLQLALLQLTGRLSHRRVGDAPPKLAYVTGRERGGAACRSGGE